LTSIRLDPDREGDPPAMPVLLVELPVGVPVLDETRFPERDRTFVPEHLRHYLSLSRPLPSIGVRAEPDRLVVTRGHSYLRAACELGQATIRAVVHPASDPDATAALLRRPDVVLLDWAALDAAERAQTHVDQWHVYFFDDPLDADQRSRFDGRIVGFFRAKGHPVHRVEHSGRRAQFLVTVPAADESWYAPYRAAALQFDETVAPITSFQGRRFQVRRS
jgi:hypothetical protein